VSSRAVIALIIAVLWPPRHTGSGPQIQYWVPAENTAVPLAGRPDR
jgi:hypothetical protein